MDSETTMASKRFRIGYALTSKKIQSFILPSLVDYASLHGMDLVCIDPHAPILRQAPFHCIIHKLYDDSWIDLLREFISEYPDVPVVDLPERISRLRDRVAMLEVVKELKIEEGDQRFGIPKQIAVFDSEDLSNGSLDAIGDSELTFPVIAKPVVADGCAESHEMCLLFNDDGLRKLSTPIVLQEFVNHGGVVFKVYVLGDHVECVKRRSLPDITAEKLVQSEGLLPFSQISNSTAHESKVSEISSTDDRNTFEETEMPPLHFVKELGRGLREGMGLRLFNFDMIRDGRDGNRYLLIDINYFPGYAKMPNFESAFTDFLLDIVHQKARTAIVDGKTE